MSPKLASNISVYIDVSIEQPHSASPAIGRATWRKLYQEESSFNYFIWNTIWINYQGIQGRLFEHVWCIFSIFLVPSKEMFSPVFSKEEREMYNNYCLRLTTVGNTR